jgi:hypothetical protein
LVLGLKRSVVAALREARKKLTEIVQTGDVRLTEPFPLLVVGDEKGGAVYDSRGDDDSIRCPQSMDCPEFGGLDKYLKKLDSLYWNKYFTKIK